MGVVKVGADDEDEPPDICSRQEGAKQKKINTHSDTSAWSQSS